MHRSIANALISLLILLTLTFALLHLIPGDPFSQEQALPKEVHEALIKRHGLNLPLWQQYLLYLRGVFQGDLGPSLLFPGLSVQQILLKAAPISLLLGMQAFLIALAAGVLLALASQRNFSLMLIAAAILSFPNFLQAAFLQYFFAYKLHWFPIARTGTFLPVIALAAMPAAAIARLLGKMLKGVLAQEYILTARMKGLSERSILFHHGLKNALIPLLPYFGQVMASIITGSFVIEKIFSLPGLGYWMIMSIEARDYPVVMGITLFSGAILITINLVIDLSLPCLDPRMKARRV